jgi:hypothetical protein
VPSWLEDEEAAKAHRDLTAAREADQLRSLETEVRDGLSSFIKLCSRVDTVRPYSLVVSGLRAEGVKPFYSAGAQPYYTTTISRPRSGIATTMRRAIRCSCSIPNTVYLEAVSVVRYRSWSDMEGTSPGHGSDVVEVRKAVSPRDLSEWSEARMLSAIQWLLLESDSIEEYLPGELRRSDLSDQTPTRTSQVTQLRSTPRWWEFWR